MFNANNFLYFFFMNFKFDWIFDFIEGKADTIQ